MVSHQCFPDFLKISPLPPATWNWNWHGSA